MDERLPDPSRDSGSLRTFNLMRLMRTMGHTVHFLPTKGRFEDPLAPQLHDIGVGLPHGMSATHSASAPAWLRRHAGDYDAIIVSRYHLAWSWLPFLRSAFPRVLRILDTVDLHHLRESREAAAKSSRLLAWAARGTRRRELAATSHADVTWVVSDSEKRLLAKALPSARVRVVSNLHQLPASVPGYEQRRDLVFVGGAQHPPNVDAVHWLLTDIFPRVRRLLPDCRLHLVGAGLREATAHLATVDGVHLHGHVPTLDSLLEGSLVGLAPLRFGAGVKGKVNQYMAHGIPTVGTPMATEGMGLTHGVDVMVAEDADQFAAAVVQLHADPRLWRQISEHGLKNVSRHFSAEAAAPEIVATLSGRRTGPAPPADRPGNGTTR
ncbi:glycosyltransferase family 4 protein [Pseudoxanthomonas putridarboris]|uniref:Glycosyltransferase family 4 protein n=1 Tax=Pseudoxanthomonas putridarboris TaxID=752605 RepID=A0ABU9J3V0_9GAMM